MTISNNNSFEKCYYLHKMCSSYQDLSSNALDAKTVIGFFAREQRVSEMETEV